MSEPLKFRDADHAVAALGQRFGIDVCREVFVLNKHKKVIYISVAAIGEKFKDISVYNPEYKAFSVSRAKEFLKVVARMANSRACRESIVRAFRTAYRTIDDLEYLDAFRAHAAERAEKEKAGK